MTERSLRVLEFHKIRAQISPYCASDMGRELAENLMPANRMDDVLRMQQETEEAHSLLSFLGGTPMLPFSDVRTALHLAQIGSALSPRRSWCGGLPARLQGRARCARDRQGGYPADHIQRLQVVHIQGR